VRPVLVGVRRPEAWLYFPAVIIGGMCLLGGMAWAYEKTRRKIEHPVYGTLTFYGDHWAGLAPPLAPGSPSVRFEIPGGKKGPEEGAVERFTAFWSRMPEVVELVRPHAVVDLENAHDAVAGTRDETLTKDIIERISADPASFDKDWTLSAVALRPGLRGGQHWTLEFEVGWDAEHQRAAYLDLDGRFLRYELSCAMVDL
jgi:hypothetical protein